MGMERLSKETRMAGVMVGSRDVSGRGDISGREEQMGTRCSIRQDAR